MKIRPEPVKICPFWGGKLKSHFLVHKIPPLVPKLARWKRIHTIIILFFKEYFNIFLHLFTCPQGGSLPTGIPTIFL